MKEIKIVSIKIEFHLTQTIFNNEFIRNILYKIE